jgi:hypothetical protein
LAGSGNTADQLFFLEGKEGNTARFVTEFVVIRNTLYYKKIIKKYKMWKSTVGVNIGKVQLQVSASF